MADLDFRPPRFSSLERGRPYKLNRVQEQIGSHSGETAGSTDRLLEAKTAVDVSVRGGTPVVDRKLLPYLIDLLETELSPKEHQAAAKLVMDAQSVSWRRLWELWEAAPQYRSAVARRLAPRLAAEAMRRPRFKQRRVPTWLPVDSQDSAFGALREPAPKIARLVESERASLAQFEQLTHISPASRMGRTVLEALIRHGPQRWWGRQDDKEVRAWCEGRTLELVAAVAERQLQGAGRSIDNGSPVDQFRELMRWCMSSLGDPAKRPGAWKQVSDKSRAVFERILISQEFARIMEEFRKHADDDRAQFWSGHQDHLRDAHYVQSSTTGICLMVFGGLLVVEFGKLGNAAYFYTAPTMPLRTLPLPKTRVKPGDFKSSTHLRFGAETMHASEDKLVHRSGWQWKANEIVADYVKQRRRR